MQQRMLIVYSNYIKLENNEGLLPQKEASAESSVTRFMV